MTLKTSIILMVAGGVLGFLGILLGPLSLLVGNPPLSLGLFAVLNGTGTIVFFIGLIGFIIVSYGRYKHTVEENQERQKKQKEGKGIIISTTDTIPGKKIVKMLGPIHARNNPFAITLDMAENTQIYLEKEAEKLGANAIVGMKIERQQHKKRTTYFAYGTAVIVEDEK